MLHDLLHHNPQVPAALPALLLSAGIALGSLLSGSDCVLVWIATALCCTLNTRTAILLGAFAVGSTVAIAAHTQERIIDANIASSNGRFVELTLRVDRPWRSSAYGSSAEASVTQPQWLEDEKIIVLGPDSSLPLTESEVIKAEGFVRRDRHERLIFVVKSNRLIRRSTSETGLALTRALNTSANDIVIRLAASSPPSVRRHLPVVKAIALGRDEELSPETRERWRRAGTYHLLVFSGMQIAMVALVIALLLRPLGTRAWRDRSLLILALIAPGFAGGAASVSRASTMLGVFALARLSRRPTRIENLFFVSAAIRLCTEPGELLHPGFGLTYAAAGGLIFIGKPLAARLRSPLAKAIVFSSSATLATAPLTIFHFNQFVPISALSTVLISPAAAATLLGTGLAIALESIGLSSTGSFILSVVLRTIDLVESFHLIIAEHLDTEATIASLGNNGLVACYLSIILLITLLRKPAAPIIVVLILTIALPAIDYEDSHDHPHVTLLDVGQGDSILLHDDETAILIDSGGFADDPLFARRVLLPQLLAENVTEIDLAILSHPDSDHCGAMSGLLREIEVRELWLNRKHRDQPCARELLDGLEAPTIALFPSHGIRTTRGRFLIETIIPRLHYKRAWVNNSSLAIRAGVADRKILLTGDLEADAEWTLVDEHPELLVADILKVAHHGSRGSTTARFLETVNPSLALISAGRDNHFGHPSEEVVARLRESGAVVRSTSQTGRITVCLAPGATKITHQD